MTEVTETQGPQAALRLLKEIVGTEGWSIDEGAESHELAHIVGRVTARQAKDIRSAFLRCERTFVHGCQHGFFEEILSARGLSMVEAAVEICGEEQTLESFLCYHGIGHGIVMASSEDLRVSLAECSRLPSNLSVLGCQQGVFMEKGDSPCGKLPRSAQWACYVNAAPFLLSRSHFDVTTASRACLRAEEDMIPPCIFTFGKLAADPIWHARIKRERGPWAFLWEAKEMCDDVPTGYEGDCYAGAIEHLLRYGKVDEAQEFCYLLDAPSQVSCLEKIRDDLTTSRSPRDLENFCADLPDAFSKVCTAIPTAEEVMVKFLSLVPGRGSLDNSSFFTKFLSILRSLKLTVD